MSMAPQIKSLAVRVLLGTVVLSVVIAIFYAMGRQFGVGAPLVAIYVAFVLSFLIAGKEIYFGFGGAAFRKICSYLVAAGCMWVALYVLWHATAS